MEDRWRLLGACRRFDQEQQEGGLGLEQEVKQVSPRTACLRGLCQQKHQQQEEQLEEEESQEERMEILF